jgi:acyl-CoA synthetase (AMP-forming)/AMP-acid ligase II
MPELGGIGEYVDVAARRSPRQPAVISLPEAATVTYGELASRSSRLAHALLAHGLRRGDRVACWLGTSLAYFDLYAAIAKAGLVIVPVNDRFTTAEARHIVEDASPAALCFDASTAGRVIELGVGTGDGVWLVEVGGGRTTAATPFEDLLAAPGSSEPPGPLPAPGLEAPFLIGYTSGTTGLPKGAVLTHGSVLAINRSNAIAYRLGLGSVGIFSGSMSFTATVPAFLLTHQYVGGTVVVTGTRDPERVADAVAAHAGNYLAVPPPLVREYAEVFGRRRDALASLVSVLQSAGPADPADLAELDDALDGRLLLGWGMTELSGGLATVTAWPDMRRACGPGATAADRAVLATVGRAVPGTSVRVEDDDGAELAADGITVGELAVRSPALMAGYWRRPDATAAAVRDGWYRTGDVGRIDPDGHVTLLDRRADLIVSGGMNVYPSEVERVLRTVPGVADCAVVAVPHPRWGRAVAAAVVAAPGAELTEDAVVAACREQLASYKKPTRLVFVDRLPRTVGDKVHRPSVVALLEAAAGPTDG